jgi:hypothetical protein
VLEYPVCQGFTITLYFNTWPRLTRFR